MPVEFEPLPDRRYGVILSDPPWHFDNWGRSGSHKGAAAKYPCVKLCDLKRIPVADVAEKDCVLFMWATFPMLPEAHELLSAWGFKHKTGFAWHKKTKHGKSAFGTGYVLRSAAEVLLVGTRGKPKPLNRSTRNVIETVEDADNCIEAMVREHSRKPDVQYEIIENLFPGPYLEMFARQRWSDNWDAWGNQTEKFTPERATTDELAALLA